MSEQIYTVTGDEEIVEYDGHPSILIPNGVMVEVVERKWLTPWKTTRTLMPQKVHITVCGECRKVRSILFLHNNRWLCQNCRDKETEVTGNSTQRGKT